MKSSKSPSRRQAGSRSEPVRVSEQPIETQPKQVCIPDWFRADFEKGCAKLKQTAGFAAARHSVLADEVAGRSEDHLAYAS